MSGATASQGRCLKEIGEIEDLGINERLDSPYCSPKVVVRKKDGGVRICVNFKEVNAVTQIDSEPMFDHLEIFNRLSDSKVFSKLDLARGFFQILFHPESKNITTFGTPEELFPLCLAF